MLTEEIRALFLKVSAGEMSPADAEVAMAALMPKRSIQEWGFAISETTGKCLIRGLRESGRPLEMSEKEVLTLADNDNAKWLEVVKYVKDNAGKFIITKKPDVAEAETEASTPEAAPAS